MGLEDVVTKAYLQDNEVFADVFNYRLFDGEPVIRPEELREMDSTRITFLPDKSAEKGDPEGTGSGNGGKQQKRKTNRRLNNEQEQILYHDLLKNTIIRRDENAIYQLRLGLEPQTRVNYAMPVRNQMYDAAEYYHQVDQITRAHKRKRDYSGLKSGEYISGFHRDDYLIPVFTLTVYFGAEPWDGPRSLHEMMRIKDPEILKLIPDYRIHLIEPAGLEKEELLKFQSSFREVMGYIKYSQNAEELIRYTKDNPRMNMDISAARVIAAMTKTEIPYEEETEGKINVCKAIDDLKAQAKAAGITEGRASGLEEGRIEGKAAGLAEGRASGICEGVEKGKIIMLAELVRDNVLTVTEAAKRADMSPEEFMKLCG